MVKYVDVPEAKDSEAVVQVKSLLQAGGYSLLASEDGDVTEWWIVTLQKDGTLWLHPGVPVKGLQTDSQRRIKVDRRLTEAEKAAKKELNRIVAKAYNDELASDLHCLEQIHGRDYDLPWQDGPLTCGQKLDQLRQEQAKREDVKALLELL